MVKLKIKNKKKIMMISAAVIVIAAVVGVLIWALVGEDNADAGKVFVSKVEDINTASKLSLNGACFSGVAEPQKSNEVKYDTTKEVKEIFVNEGDYVDIGDELFIYDVEAMELDKEQIQLEIERMENEIKSNKNNISELESEKKNASGDELFSYTSQIQSLEADNEKLQYDIKVKKSETGKLSNAISNAIIVSEFTGTVGKIKDMSGNSSTDEMNGYYGGTQMADDVIMTVTESGSLRIKGRINEQNMSLIYEGMPVIISSRADSNMMWRGAISEISSEPSQNDNNMMYYGGMDDEMTTSSNYNFYIEPETAEGLMLGQHVIIKPDGGQAGAGPIDGDIVDDEPYGDEILDDGFTYDEPVDDEVNEDEANESVQSGVIEKTGIWLYEDYIVTDEDGNSFVWAADKKDRLEKRTVEIGAHDTVMGDCEIVSGLEESDRIAYPSADYEEGLPVTEDINEADVKYVTGSDDITDDGMIDDGMIDDGFTDDGVIDDGMYDENIDIDGELSDKIYDDGADILDNLFGDADTHDE